MESPADYIFAERDANVYAILDGASIDDLLDKLYHYLPEFVCLYRGELQPDVAEVAPYLMRLTRESAFTDWLLDRGWGNHWGIFAISRENLDALRKHFRRFLRVQDSKGQPMLFRYYDPRVLRVYLPTCDPKELETVFGPVMHYITENESPHDLVRFQCAKGVLASSVKRLMRDELCG